MKISVKLLGILGLLLTCNLFAEENNVKYSIALVGMSMDYKEYDSANTFLDSETSSLGKINGYNMSLGYLFNRSSVSVDEIYIDLMRLGTFTAYDGFIRGTTTPHKGTTTNKFIDASLGYKHTYRFNNRFDIYYGLGFGYHAWDRKLSSIQDELYEWHSIRPIIGTTLRMQKFNLGIFTEYQYGFNTKMGASDTNDSYKLGGANIFVVGFPLRYDYSDKLEFFTQYTLSTQTIKASNVVNGLLEPDSTSYQNYLKIGATFKF